jgi:division protein CdvB (Snf7/Vps24/ESCRT-III family)
VQVALGLDRQVDHAVARDLVQHVVEEADAGGELGNAAAVEIEDDADLRFQGVARDVGLPHGRW